MNMRWSIPFLLVFILCSFGAVYHPENVRLVTDNLQINAGDTAWMLTAAALVLLMTPGVAFFYGGMVGKKNVISTMLQSYVAMGVVSLFWVLCGFSLSFGESINGVIGNPMTFFMFNGVDGRPHADFSPTFPFALFALFQLKFAIITPALITGAFAERMRFSSYLLFMLLFSVCIYCPLAHMTWHPEGLLRTLGVLDFAGGTVVHMSAGIAALAGAIVLGKRKHYGRKEAPAHIPFVLLGAGMLWFGWFGFNSGSALSASGDAAHAFLTTNTASAAAMLAWLFFDGLFNRKLSAIGACIGAVVGLVAITPAAGFVTVGESMFIGCIAAIICNLSLHASTKTNVDDTLDVFPCHGVGGIVGMIATGVFAADVGLTSGETTTFYYHCLAVVGVGLYCFIGSLILFKITNVFVPLRVSEEEEEQGLDVSQHGEAFFDHEHEPPQLALAS